MDSLKSAYRDMTVKERFVVTPVAMSAPTRLSQRERSPRGGKGSWQRGSGEEGKGRGKKGKGSGGRLKGLATHTPDGRAICYAYTRTSAVAAPATSYTFAENASERIRHTLARTRARASLLTARQRQAWPQPGRLQPADLDLAPLRRPSGTPAWRGVWIFSGFRRSDSSAATLVRGLVTANEATKAARPCR